MTRRQKQHSISRDLSISVFLLAVLIQAPLVFYYFTREYRQISDTLHVKADNNARQLADVLAVPVWDLDNRQIQRICRGFGQNDLVVGIRIQDKNGRVFFDSSSPEMTGDGFFPRSAPIRYRNREIGTTHLIFSRHPYQQDLNRLRNRTLLVLGLSLFGIYFGVGLLFRIFMRTPLTGLRNGIRRLAKGEYQNAFDNVRHEELSEIAATFRDMATQIQARENVLQIINQELQEEIAERKKAEDKATRSEERRRALLDAVPDMIFHFDANGIFLDFQGAKEDLQFDPDTFLGRNIADTLPPEIATLLLEKLTLALSMRTPQIFEYKMSFSGTIRHFEARLVAATESTAIAIIRNITETVQAEKERARLEASLTKAQKMEAIGMLAGGVAHDLNNVLSGLVSYPELLLRDLPEDSPLRRRVAMIQKSGEKAAHIVQDLLTLARRGVTVTEIVQLNTIIQDYLTSPECEKLRVFHQSVRFSLALTPDLPFVTGSPVHLSKMLMNLVSNGAEAMPDGGILSIETSHVVVPPGAETQVPPGQYVQLLVQDTGIGIEEEEIARIFEPFYTKKVMGRSGTGLGMAVVWGTVTDHNGFIDVESKLREGTRFTIHLPISHHQVTVPAISESPLDATGLGQRILVVDDVPEQREIASLILQKLGYQVETADSGEAALAFLETDHADLVMLDMIMDPGIDGLETYSRIRKITPQQRVILVSGFSETERVRKAISSGALAYVKKPYTIATLGKAIQGALHTRPAPSHP